MATDSPLPTPLFLRKFRRAGLEGAAEAEGQEPAWWQPPVVLTEWAYLPARWVGRNLAVTAPPRPVTPVAIRPPPDCNVRCGLWEVR